jgi:hypothetical protein
MVMRLWYARISVAAVAALAGTVLAVPGAAATPAPEGTPAPHVTGITLNGARVGRAFAGVGAISGGGGNSRLLIDYPARQRQQILDYLFKPGYGADLQILKLEIGGDAYATDGSEPSVEQTKGSIDCAAGYELWLAKQARALDPGIQLYALQWNAPGWVGGTTADPWTSADIGYLIDWLHCATSAGLRINYLGGWNEHLNGGITPQVMEWFVELRAALDQAGYGRVQIVAADSFARLNGGDVSDYLAGHPAFRRAISVLGYHNLCKYPATGKVCSLPAAATASGKPVWESEIGALRETTGVPAMARSINNAFIQVGATGLIEWPLVSSMPAALPEEDRGLILASQPWSGHYTVSLMAWVIAQTTQFTQPGWRHIAGASGQLGGPFGSYTSYESPGHTAWSLVAQTTEAPRAQTIAVRVDRGLPASVVHVWSTNLNSARPRSWFVRSADVDPRDGEFRYVLQPGYVYTFTTSTGQGNARQAAPAASPMPLPYTATPDASGEPAELGPQDGSFQYLPGSSTTFQQTTVGTPVFWQNPVATRFPYAVVGDTGWSNYTVSATVSFTGTGQSAGLISRFSHPRANGVAQEFYGYQLTVSQSGAWSLIRNSIGKAPATLESGNLPSGELAVNAPVSLSLTAQGSTLTGQVDGTAIPAIKDVTYQTGDAGISTGGWYAVDFSNLTVTG